MDNSVIRVTGSVHPQLKRSLHGDSFFQDSASFTISEYERNLQLSKFLYDAFLIKIEAL